jgi:MFS family permease
MRSWTIFFRQNKNLVLFGFLLTFFSSFGQTFFVSLFVPEVLQEFSITNASFGSLYALATLISALCLTWLGSFIDKVDLRTYSWLVITGLCLSLLIFSQASQIIWLGIGLWGMRLAGQGLMSHTSVTTMARYFTDTRGKAISMATLGHAAGGVVFPVLVALCIQAAGWRTTLFGCALLLIVLLPPLLAYLLQGVSTDPAAFRHTPQAKPSAAKEDKGAAANESSKKSSPYSAILSSKAFWNIAPGVLAIPFLNTAIFFYQLPLGESKGWSAEWVAASFTAYAIASAVCTLIAGQWTDTLSARQLFPYFLFPLFTATVLIFFIDSPWITPVFFVLMGVSSGVGNTVKSALQAEVFGVEFLGTVRSLFSALMVVSTAMGPAAFGFLLDAGYSFEWIFAISALYLVLTILWNFRLKTVKI